MIPRAWTPEMVAQRLSDALLITIRTAGRVGPKGYGSTMPEVFREFSDFVRIGEAGWAEYVADRTAAFVREGECRFSAAEMAASEEAISWPARFLPDDPLARDAIWLVLGRAVGANIDRTLKRRRHAADRMRDKYDPASIRRDAGQCRDIAETIAAQVNEAMAAPLSDDAKAGIQARKFKDALSHARGVKRLSLLKGGLAAMPLDPKEIESAIRMRNMRIKRGAAIRLRRDVLSNGAIRRVLHTVKRGEVVEGRNFNPGPLYQRFDKALRGIAAALTGGGVN
jgi:hypothetical protein